MLLKTARWLFCTAFFFVTLQTLPRSAKAQSENVMYGITNEGTLLIIDPRNAGKPK